MTDLGTKIGLRFLQLYRIFISPVLGPACRFEPSCSRYATEVLERFGLVRGSWLAIRRVVRCHPLAESGYDPVPERVVDGS